MSCYAARGIPSIPLYAAEKNAIVVDLRSDTFTKPTKTMREAMFNAEVGDDVYEEDPTVKVLEEKAARLLGKEAAIFVTSGTMGNLIAVLNHCDVRGSEAYCGEDSHVFLHEQGGAAQLGGTTITTLPNNKDGTFDLERLESKFRRDRLHEPISKLVLVENTLNGKIIPQSWIEKLVELCWKYDLKLHMDGARIWNASIASGIPVKEIASKFDSVTFCLSKGLGAPIGSLLCGTKSFISRSRRIRKVLGGGMRQVGILAAAGLVALDENVQLLKDDHRRARATAQAISDLNSKVFTVDCDTVQTNMIFVNIESNVVTARDFIERLELVKADTEEERVIVRGLALTKSLARFVFYYEITDAMTQSAILKITHVMKELERRGSN